MQAVAPPPSWVGRMQSAAYARRPNPARRCPRTWPREPVRPMTFMTIASFTGVSCRHKQQPRTNYAHATCTQCAVHPAACVAAPRPGGCPCRRCRRASMTPRRAPPGCSAINEPAARRNFANRGPARQHAASLAAQACMAVLSERLPACCGAVRTDPRPPAGRSSPPQAFPNSSIRTMAAARTDTWNLVRVQRERAMPAAGEPFQAPCCPSGSGAARRQHGAPGAFRSTASSDVSATDCCSNFAAP